MLHSPIRGLLVTNFNNVFFFSPSNLIKRAGVRKHVTGPANVVHLPSTIKVLQLDAFMLNLIISRAAEKLADVQFLV